MWLIEKCLWLFGLVMTIVFLVLGSAIVFLFMVVILTFLIKFIFDVDLLPLLREWIALA